jgi:formylglycine-generating enzyme required for sulfatase activity
LPIHGSQVNLLFEKIFGSRQRTYNMSQRWADILIYIGPQAADGGYPVTAQLNDGSHYRGGELHLDMASLLSHSLDPQAYGLELFYTLFSGPIRRAYDKVTGRAEAESDGRLRVRLWIDDRAAELHALPWERLYHTHRGQDVPLATSILTPFSRYTGLEISEAKPLTQPPLRMLYAVSNPRDLPADLKPIQVEDEIANLQAALGDLLEGDRLQVTLMPGCTGLPTGLRSELERGGYRIVDGAASLNNLVRALAECHVLHFLGHGRFVRRTDLGPGTAALYLENDSGEVQLVKDDEVVDKLAAVHPQPHLVFLAACESATRDAQAEHAFIGLGPKIVAAGVPAVIAMQDLVPMEIARQLTADFYHNLVEHGSVDLAMNQARLLLAGHGQIDWAIPVLFMRLEDGVLVDFSEAQQETPHLPFEPETVLIPASRFMMGSAQGENVPEEETPQHAVDLPAYRLGRYPVTNREYQAFLQHNPQYEPPRKTGWFLREPPAVKLDHPVVGVSWQDAQAYCRWLSQQSGRAYRLPTEAEWEKAARGSDARPFPWGEHWQEGACNAGGEDTTPVSAHPLGASTYGSQDMLGNVQEWTSTIWGISRKQCDFPYPFQPFDGREDLEAEQRAPRLYRIHRGGSFYDEKASLNCTRRSCALSSSATRERGFRVVQELPPTR